MNTYVLKKADGWFKIAMVYSIEFNKKKIIIYFNPAKGKPKIVTRKGKGGGQNDPPWDFLFADRIL